jgi:hypothetical protein
MSESPYRVPMSDLLAVKVAPKDQVEEQDPDPPHPDAKTDEDRALEAAGGPVGPLR